MKIALHKANGFTGKLISWQTRSIYCHASIVLRGYLVEAMQFHGVRRLRNPDLRNADVFTVNQPLPNLESAIAWLHDQVGKDYDYSSVLRFISRRQASRRSSGKWFCSELVFAFVKKAGVELLSRSEPWEISPSLLARSPYLERENGT